MPRRRSCAPIAVRTGAFTPVRDRDVHSVPIPRLGGVAIFLGFAAAMLAASHLPFLRQVFDTGELRGVLWGAAHRLPGRGDRRHPRARLADQAGRAR